MKKMHVDISYGSRHLELLSQKSWALIHQLSFQFSWVRISWASHDTWDAEQYIWMSDFEKVGDYVAFF